MNPIPPTPSCTICRFTWATMALTAWLAAFLGGYYCGYVDGFESFRDTATRQSRETMRQLLHAETFLRRVPPLEK